MNLREATHLIALKREHPLKRTQFNIMLTDTTTIRYYQKLTDAMVDLWQRGYRFDEVRLYMDGYLSCLRHTNTLESFLIHRLEEEAFRFLRDPSNFELSIPQVEPDYY